MTIPTSAVDPDAVGIWHPGNVVVAYQQPLGDAIGILTTAVLWTLFSLALVRDIGGIRSSVAADVARRNARAPWRWLLVGKRNRAGSTDSARINEAHRRLAWAFAAIGVLMLVVELSTLALNGVR